MNKFEIHLLLAGFSYADLEVLTELLEPLPVNVHSCSLTEAVESLPKVHLLFIQLPQVAVDEQAPQQHCVAEFVAGLKQLSPYCIPYLCSSVEQAADLSAEFRDGFRDIVEYPVAHAILQPRLFCIIDDLNNKFIQLLKKRRLKQQVQDGKQALSNMSGELQKSSDLTRETNKQLIRLLSNQVFARMGQRASGRNQQLNFLLHEMAKKCGLNDQQSQDLINAWHLRNIGKMSFSDQIINTPYIKLSIAEQRLFNAHPTLSHAAMMIVRPLDRAAKIVAQHKEYLDGSGYPNGLKGQEISEQAQLLTVVNDYTELVSGRYSERAYSTEEALAYLDNYASERYSDDMVKHLCHLLPRLSKAGKGMHDTRVHSKGLKLGMQLTRDLISKDGILLLSEGLVFDLESIARVQEMETNLHEYFELFIKKK